MAWIAVMEKMVVLVVLILIGYICARKGIITEAFNKVASQLVMTIFLTAVILNAGLDMESGTDPMDFLIMTGMTFVALFLCGAVGFAAAAVLGLKAKDRGVAWDSIMFMNNVFVGFPVAAAVYGSAGVFYAALTEFPFCLLMYTFGLMLLRDGEEGGRRFRIQDVLCAPMLATIGAIILFLLPFDMPGVVTATLDTLGAATVPLSMLVVGTSLSTVSIREAIFDKRALLCTFARLIVCPVLAWALFRLIMPAGMEMAMGVLVLICACPSAAVNTILAVQFEADDVFASKINFDSTVLCALTLPLMTALLL